MDIRGMIAPPSPSSALPTRPVTDSLRVTAQNKPVEPVRETRADTAQSNGNEAAVLPLSATLKLDIDEATKQVYAKVVDPGTGTLLRELPSEKLRALQAFAMKTLRPIVDTKA
jgi:uncharacterized FlaG/YvyC family protein